MYKRQDNDNDNELRFSSQLESQGPAKSSTSYPSAPFLAIIRDCDFRSRHHQQTLVKINTTPQPLSRLRLAAHFTPPSTLTHTHTALACSIALVGSWPGLHRTPPEAWIYLDRTTRTRRTQKHRHRGKRPLDSDQAACHRAKRQSASPLGSLQAAETSTGNIKTTSGSSATEEETNRCRLVSGVFSACSHLGTSSRRHNQEILAAGHLRARLTTHLHRFPSEQPRLPCSTHTRRHTKYHTIHPS